MHPDLTEEMMKQNPLVFGMYSAKIKELTSDDNIIKLPRGFDLFNRRTEFPYDIIDNAMRIDPHIDDRE